MAAVPSIGRASLVEAPRVAPQAAATEGLYERHAAKIQSYCHHQLGSREEAEDAVQTTFMNAFRALGRGVVPEAESAWLFKIAENVCLSRRRSSWRRGKIESPSDFGVIEEIVPGPNRQRDELIGIEDALASMPEQQRRAILLREWQGLSYREVAEELDVSQSAVETLIFRARRSLAQGLEQPDSIKPAKRKSFRRALHALDLGTVVAALKTLLAGSAAVKATAAAVAVTAAAGTAVTVAPQPETKPPVNAPAKALVAPAPAASPSKSFSIASTPVRTTGSASKPPAARTSRPAKKKPVRAAVTRSAPVSAARFTAPSAPLVDEPLTPVAEPVHTAPAAPAEQPVAEHAPRARADPGAAEARARDAAAEPRQPARRMRARTWASRRRARAPARSRRRRSGAPGAVVGLARSRHRAAVPQCRRATRSRPSRQRQARRGAGVVSPWRRSRLRRRLRSSRTLPAAPAPQPVAAPLRRHRRHRTRR